MSEPGSGQDFKPYIAAEAEVPEFTLKAILLGSAPTRNMRLSTDGVCIKLLTLTKDRYAGFRAVADERNESPTALMHSLEGGRRYACSRTLGWAGDAI